MCNKIQCAGQYTVDLINNTNISRDVQEECANSLLIVINVENSCAALIFSKLFNALKCMVYIYIYINIALLTTNFWIVYRMASFNDCK